jgi:hypothetical protein
MAMVYDSIQASGFDFQKSTSNDPPTEDTGNNEL